MVRQLRRLFLGLPPDFPAVMAVASAFTAFIALDQMHWWRLKPDYAFGWLVPLFAVYVIYERLGRLRTLAAKSSPVKPRGPLPRLSSMVALGLLAAGLLVFAFGAIYRAGAGASQPGSLALAIGYAGLLPGMVFFSFRRAQTATDGKAGRFWDDPALRAAALFLFPSLIWLLSAPLLTAVENTVSLFLLRRVVGVVFAVFNFLGLPVVQEGNVLVLPHGQVGVADACSGIRSLMGCLFAGTFLAAVFLDRFWKKTLLVGAALLFAFAGNLLRSLFLTAWAYRYGSEAIEGTLHDATGFAVLGLTCVGLFSLLPLFRRTNWIRWLRLEIPAPCIRSKDTA